MAGEVMIPLLPCRDLDESLAFYAALGFEQTYRQSRPNPSAVVAEEDIQIHLFGLDAFDPEWSHGTCWWSCPTRTASTSPSPPASGRPTARCRRRASPTD